MSAQMLAAASKEVEVSGVFTGLMPVERLIPVERLMLLPSFPLIY